MSVKLCRAVLISRAFRRKILFTLCIGPLLWLIWSRVITDHLVQAAGPLLGHKLHEPQSELQNTTASIVSVRKRTGAIAARMIPGADHESPVRGASTDQSTTTNTTSPPPPTVRRSNTRFQLTAPATRHIPVYNHSLSAIHPWIKERTELCGGRFIGYSSEFAQLRGVVVDRTLCRSDRVGGEYVEDVVNQREDTEYVTYSHGFFQLKCGPLHPPQFTYQFSEKSHVSKWMNSLRVTDDSGVGSSEDQRRNEFTVAVLRYEYANLFHTMTDWYNTFLMMAFFNHTPSNTNVLLVDAHPHGALDDVWSRLFNSTTLLSSLPLRTNFTDLVWGIMGYNSPMTIYPVPNKTPPLYEEFRSFFLSSYGIDPAASNTRPLDCDQLSVLFIWRRDYVAHPRNPQGRVTRQIHNEAAILTYIRSKHPRFRVVGEQIDAFDMYNQLRLVSSADILIGMHGAGLTHALFLPYRRAGLIELRPSYATSSGDHFRAISEWRGLVYESWNNNDPVEEVAGRATRVPPTVVDAMLAKVVKRLCKVDSHSISSV